MKLYNSMGPNPQVVRTFAAELGTELATVEIDIMAAENRKPDYLARNPRGQLPALELEDGTIIAEITAICEYLDDLKGGTSLIGTTAEERAATRMWTRRVDLGICEPLANGFRFSEGLPIFQDRMPCFPEASEPLKAMARDKLAWLNDQLSGQAFLCGDRFTLADILLYCFLNFGKNVGQPYDEGLEHVHAWFQRVGARPSASA
ncbi:MAG: glutathione S-transferase [Pseudomonadota bacterium]